MHISHAVRTAGAALALFATVSFGGTRAVYAGPQDFDLCCVTLSHRYTRPWRERDSRGRHSIPVGICRDGRSGL